MQDTSAAGCANSGVVTAGKVMQEDRSTLADAAGVDYSYGSTKNFICGASTEINVSVDPTTADAEEGKSDCTSEVSYNFDPPEEPLNPGDVIQYACPLYCAGNPQGSLPCTLP